MSKVNCKGNIVMADDSVAECKYRKNGICTAEEITIDFDEDRPYVSCPEDWKR